MHAGVDQLRHGAGGEVLVVLVVLDGGFDREVAEQAVLVGVVDVGLEAVLHRSEGRGGERRR